MYLFRLIFLFIIIDAIPRLDAAAPKQPPVDMIHEYTMESVIPIEYFFVDDTNGTGTHYSYGAKYIEKMLDGSRKYISKLEQLLPEAGLESVTEHMLKGLRIHKNDWLYLALLKNRPLVHGKRVAVIGSSEPRIEVILSAFGAASISTVEYNELTYGDGVIIPVQTVSRAKFDEFYKNSEAAFDVVVSISSIEHDGLGRYGDPLNPNADLETMAKIKHILKPNGVLVLSVPIGPDVTVFNLHRRYGNIRLPLLLSGWTEVGRVPQWGLEKLEAAANWRQTFEPIFLLRPGDRSARDGNPGVSHGHDTDTTSYDKTIDDPPDRTDGSLQKEEL